MARHLPDKLELGPCRNPGDLSVAPRHVPPFIAVKENKLRVISNLALASPLGERAGGNSLDNTIRVARRVPTEWLLLDVRIHAVAHGFGHGLVHMWAEDGSLLATASQSAIVRRWKEPPP